MYTLKPLSTTELQQKIIERKLSISAANKRLELIGLAFVFTGSLAYMFTGIDIDPAALWLSLLKPLVLAFGFVVLGMPWFLRNVANIENTVIGEYSPASKEKQHNCEAFVQMPGMEQWCKYLDAIKTQHREPTEYECNQIIEYWNKLV